MPRANSRALPAVRHLPDRFPVGTHYVVEGAPDRFGEFRITSRYVVLPNGIQVALPVAGRGPAPRRRPRAPARGRALQA
jgi:hypothetical protein